MPNNPVTVGGIVGIDITGHIRLGSPNFMPKFQHTNQFQYLDTLTWLKGRHQWKFGADVMLPMNNEYFDVAPTRGNLTFNAQFTGNAFADFLLGYAQRAQLTNVFVVNQALWSTSFFAQDDWKATDALTVNLGPALRLHDAGVSKPTTAWRTSIRAGAGSLVFAKDGSLERPRARQPGQEQLRAADRRRLQDLDRTPSSAAATGCSSTSSSGSGPKISSR